MRVTPSASTGLDELDFEILTPGSRGVLGMGAEPARIIAAPRSALGGAAPRREAAAQTPLPPPPPREPRPDRPEDGRTQLRPPWSAPPIGAAERSPDRNRSYGGQTRAAATASRASNMTAPEAAAAAGMRPPRDSHRGSRPTDRSRGGTLQPRSRRPR